MRICLAVILTIAVSASAEDWSRWRGPRGDGTWHGPKVAATWNDGDVREIWTKPIAGGYAGVSVADNRVYVMDRRTEPQGERVFCLNAADGEIIWTHAYDADYGDLTYNSGPRAAVTIHDGRVYSLGAVGHAFCLDARTGNVIWSIDAMKDLASERPKWGFAASPVILDDTVILHVGAKPGGCVIAVDRLTGQEVWRAGDDPAGYCTPIVITHRDRRLIICWNPMNVIGVDPVAGRQLWSIAYPVQYGVSIATPIFHHGLVLVAGYWHGSKAIRLGDAPADAKLAWEDPEMRGLMSQPLYRNGTAYLLDARRGLRAFELKTGKGLWEDEQPRMTARGRNPQAALVWLNDNDDRALALNAEGELVLMRLTPAGYTELARRKIIGETWAHPAFAGNRVYARDDKRIVCVELPPTVE